MSRYIFIFSFAWIYVLVSMWSPWHQPIKFASLIGNCNVLKALLGFDSWVNFGTIEFSKYISKKNMFSTCSPTKKTHRPQNLLFEKQNRLCDLNCGGRCANMFFLERNKCSSQVWTHDILKSEHAVFPSPWYSHDLPVCPQPIASYCRLRGWNRAVQWRSKLRCRAATRWSWWYRGINSSGRCFWSLGHGMETKDKEDIDVDIM